MNRLEHLLDILTEECCEVGIRASKAMRFGTEEVQPGQDLSNAERIIVEFNDLIGVMEMLRDEGVFKELFDRKLIEAKKVKVEEYLLLSKKLGKLTE